LRLDVLRVRCSFVWSREGLSRTLYPHSPHSH
jgi:hypothetical protein